MSEPRFHCGSRSPRHRCTRRRAATASWSGSSTRSTPTSGYGPGGTWRRSPRERLGMSDHSWVHVQVVLNIALRLLRLLVKGGIEPAMVADHGMKDRDAEVVVAGGALLHDVGMSIHRADHEAYSLFLAAERLDVAARGRLRGARAHGRDRRRSCTRSSATAAAASPTRSRPAWCASPTRSTWRRAARGSRSRPARRHPLPLGGGDRRGPDRGAGRSAPSGSRSR